MARIRRIDVNLTTSEKVSSKSIPSCWVMAFFYKTRFIYFNGSIGLPFDFENPFIPNCFVVGWKMNKFPDLIDLHRFFHRFPPFFLSMT